MGLVKFSVFIAAVALALFYVSQKYDFMNGLTEHAGLGPAGLQVAMTAFCLAPGSLSRFEDQRADDHWDPTKVSEKKREFGETGETREDEYEKQSVYSLLYSVYRAVGKVKHTDGSLYQFTFNTWGISNDNDKPYGPEEPQRHGKASYHGLATFDKVKDYIKEHDGKATMLEIGCGTGAGANLITREIHPTIKYIAVDMQKAGIETCKQIHATADNPNLNCVHSNGKSLPVADNSVDIVIVAETHIAEMEIGDEEKKIFAEMIRVLKPGGIFVWGNALPTKVWFDAYTYLESVGFSPCGQKNVTGKAILARDQDVDRVNLYVDQALATFPVFNLPSIGPKCKHVCDRLIKNFYRHPGTDLYERMVSGDDSYMHLCYSLSK